MISFKEKFPVLDDTTDTMKIDEIMVTGMEYFLIPKYNGINAMHDAAIAFIITTGIRCMIKEIVNVSENKWKLLLIMQKTAVTKTFDTIIELKVKRTIIANFEAINFFLFIGYINAKVIVLYLNSPIISLAINALAKIINTALTVESIRLRAV